MNIAILGGSFNPPHLGHLLIADQILKFTECDEVWLTPCYHHTFAKNLAPVKDRVAMVKLLDRTNSKIKYCGEEIENKLSGDSIDLLNILKKKYPHHKFFFIIGSDNLSGFKRWGHWEKLIRENNFLIFPRPGFSTNLVDYDLDDPSFRFKTINNSLIVTTNISSTIIRERIKKNLSVKHFLPEKVEQYILINKLYI